MARKPRKLTDRAIDGRMWGGILSIGLVMALATLFTIDLFVVLSSTVDGRRRHPRSRDARAL